MLWQIIFLTAGILSLIYYSAICIALKKWDSTFSRFWLAAGITGIVSSRLVCYPGISAVLEGIAGIGVCLLLIAEMKIINGMRVSEEKISGNKWIIVLGAQVRGRKITDSLKRRLDRALKYLEEHPEVKVIVSGGQGRDEEVTEAFAMAEYLKRAGIDPDRIILEERSVNTLENLRFSRQMIPDADAPVGIVSNNFHVYRGCMYAEQAGFIHPFPIPASCHPLLFANYMVRECLAVWKLWLKK